MANSIDKAEADTPAINPNLVRSFLWAMKHTDRYASTPRRNLTTVYGILVAGVAREHNLDTRDTGTMSLLETCLYEADDVYHGKKPNVYRTDEEVAEAQRMTQIQEEIDRTRANAKAAVDPAEELKWLLQLMKLVRDRGWYVHPSAMLDVHAVMALRKRIDELKGTSNKSE